MKPIAQTVLVLFLISAAATLVAAKRSAPKDVPHITKNAVTYPDPHDQMGTVVDKTEKSGTRMFHKQIYVVKYDPDLESDVQDCFITDLKFDGNNLIVSNEREGQFELNPDTLAVKVLKGSEVVAKKK